MTVILIVCVALFFLAMGGMGILSPARILAIFKVELKTHEGRNEVRAVYGGYGLAMSGILFFSLSAPSLRAGILVCVAVAMLGMALGRLISFLIERQTSFYPLLFLAVEIMLAFTLFAAFSLPG